MNITAHTEKLQAHVDDHEAVGSEDVSGALGIQKMPAGYALMINPDRTYFYWLKEDGSESSICWDKWAVYRGAKNDSIPNEDFRGE